MTQIKKIIDELKAKPADERNISPQFGNRFSSTAASEIDLSNLGNVDKGLLEFWRYTETAELFKDESYGQWGLRILAPSAARKLTVHELIERPRDMHSTDLVFAEFLGDSDQLLMDLALEDSHHKPVYVKLPLDRRYDWPRVADSFEEFLEKYVDANGEKFWESRYN